MNNTDLWDELEKTDPTYTKDFTGRGGFSGTAINATWIIKRLTQMFGPCGRGWKFVLEDEQIVDGHTLSSGDKARLHKVLGHIEYYQEGNWYKTSPQFGQTMLVFENKHGAQTDEDAPKKSITDCLGKCAVMLGVGADVHLGLFDDSKYVSSVTESGGAVKDKVIEPRRTASAPAAKPSEAAKKAAIAFAQQAGKDLAEITLREQLTAWLSINQPKVDRLKEYDQELADTVTADIIEARTRVK